MNIVIGTVIIVSFTSFLIAGCANPPPPHVTDAAPCVKLPNKSTDREKKRSIKLSADLIAGIAKPGLEATYESKLNDAYAEISQKNLDQLVLIEFLVCAKSEYKDEISPEALAAMDKALQRAINRTAGAQSLSGGISAHSRERLGESKYGAEKLSALARLGH